MSFNNLTQEQMLEWVWDEQETTNATVLRYENKEVCFHPSYSSGTAAVRGNVPCTTGWDYYWEIEMLTPLYGTDVMVGVGTTKANLRKFQFQFGSLLGSDEESWGYSYNGILHHNGILRQYGAGFTQGSIVGIHLDMWHGTLTFFLNRERLGVAFTSLKAHALYPMVCSTAARSAMRVVCSYSHPSSLQLLCLKTLGTKFDLVEKVRTIPGLRACAEKAFWLLLPPGLRSAADGDEINQFCLEDEDSDVDERHMMFSHEIFAGKFHRPIPVSVIKRQPPKRTSDCKSGSAQGNCSKLQEDLCVVCQRPEKTDDQPTTGGNSSKRLCLVCDFIF